MHTVKSRRRGWLGLTLLLLLAACSAPPTTSPTESASPVATSRPPAPPVSATAPATDSPAPTPEPTPSSPEAPPPAVATPTVYEVASGDTLLDLALRFGVPMAAIQLHSGLGAATDLRVGQVLTIPPASEWPGASPFWVIHEVQPGETLSQIAAHYGADPVALININALNDADILSVGDWIVLPLDSPIEQAALAQVAPLQLAVTTEPGPEATPTLAPTAAPTLPPDVPPPAEVVDWPTEVLRLINEQRAANGLPPYTYNETLALSARLHGADCQQRGSCNHTGSDGSTIKDRVLRVGYPAAGWAECIVYSSSPAQAVYWWMDEVPPDDWHRRTLLSTWVTEIGIAVVPIPGLDGYYYFIADFGRPQ